MTLRLAMWSGPRNISTAMMRAWENRPDCNVVDEPFYACYLAATGIRHPMYEQVIASQSSDWRVVAGQLAEDRARVLYQKHMTHHMLPGVDMSWAKNHWHCFLIRDPRLVVASYSQKRDTVSIDDIGIVRQLELYREITALTGQDIPVVDSDTVLKDPVHALTQICRTFGLDFVPEMISWPAGKRSSDGVWASHWYQSVEQSTGFAPYTDREVNLNAEQLAVAESSLEAYQTLKASPFCIN